MTVSVVIIVLFWGSFWPGREWVWMGFTVEGQETQDLVNIGAQALAEGEQPIIGFF